MKFQKPEIPEDLTGLSQSELTELRAAIVAWGIDAKEGATVAVLDELSAANDTIGEIDAHLATFESVNTTFTETVALEETPAATKEEVKEDAPKAEKPKATPKAEDTPAVDIPEVPAAAGAAVEPTPPDENPGAPEGGDQFGVPNLVGMSSHAPETPAPRRGLPVGALKAASGMNGINAGETFASGADFGKAIVQRARDIAGGSNEKFTVAKAFATFDAAHQLTESKAHNLELFGGADPLEPEAVTAAMCAPAEPIYEVGCMSSTERPVRGSLATYGMPRGAVTVYPNPVLADITGQSAGTGVWTKTNDADADAVKSCATIPCSTPVEYDLYGVYRCLTVKNLLAMTFDELVQAYLNRLAAIHAALAEKTLLTSMSTGANTHNVTFAGTTGGTSIGASLDLWNALLQAIEVYRSQERYTTQMLDAWIPRWVCTVIRMDIATQPRTSGQFTDRLVSEAQITAALREVGVDVTWTIESAASWTAVGSQADSSALVTLPTTAKFILSPKGNYRLGDRGELNIGVTNNNLYRDNASNARNQFSFFFENFETLIDFGCRTYEIAISNFVPTGIQPGLLAVGGTAPA